MDRDQLKQELNLSIEFIEPTNDSKNNRPGTAIVPTSFTIHNTGNTAQGANADRHSNHVRVNRGYPHNGRWIKTSWHFTVDDKKVIQQLPINELSYHAGAQANASSIAIENCMHSDMDREEARERLIKLLALLIHETGIGSDKILTHKHWTGKDCPKILHGHMDEIREKAGELARQIRGRGRTETVLSGTEGRPSQAPDVTQGSGAEPTDYDYDIDHDAMVAAIEATG